MATDEQMLAAMVAAVDGLPAVDRGDGNKRALARWKALLPFLPTPAVPERTDPRARLLVDFVPETDQHRQDIAELERKTKALLAEVIRPSS